VCVCVYTTLKVDTSNRYVFTEKMGKRLNGQASVSTYNDLLTSWRSAIIILASASIILHRLTPHYNTHNVNLVSSDSASGVLADPTKCGNESCLAFIRTSNS